LLLQIPGKLSYWKEKGKKLKSEKVEKLKSWSEAEVPVYRD